MDIIQKIKSFAVSEPMRPAFISGDFSLTYKELWTESDALARWLLRENPVPQEPIAVYGHKHPRMLVCFLACVKAGCAYCPIDLSVPDARVSSIIRTLPSQYIFAVENFSADAQGKRVLSFDEIEAIISAETDPAKEVPAKACVQGTETFYIIFTSGSTGTPKGVQISADCLNHYLDWSKELSGLSSEEHLTYLNQAPFSFDLSVMDLYTCLATGGTLFCLEKSVQTDYKKLVQTLHLSHADVWVSTPSFAEMCLSERSINKDLLPDLRAFLFCGEALGNRTVKKLQERFPDSRIVNTYGPTESTVAVTDILITPKLNEEVSPLPVGKAKPGTVIEIRDENGRSLSEEEKGEIIILGDTVSTGYYHAPELTDQAFFTVEDPEYLKWLGFSSPVRGYHTGDKGYLKDGVLYYCGRIDLQVKLHGYRIELEDIESNLRKLPLIDHAVVLPNTRGGKVSSLTAYVVEKTLPADEKAEVVSIKEQLSAFLPDYMIPKKYIFLDQMPMTNNGKADRKLLGGIS